MQQRHRATAFGGLTILLAAALIALPGDADARGGGRRGGGSSSSPAAKPAPGKSASDRDGPTININIRTSPRTSSPSGVAGPGAAALSSGSRLQMKPIPVEEPPDPEEQARRAAAMAAYEKAMSDKAAAQAEAKRQAAERAEAERLALEKAEAARAAQKAAEERAEAARQAAAIEQKKREQAAVAADVDRVLERARDDYPVLRTPEGEPLLRSILARQKVLQARGMYPATAMVEAVADHSDALQPRRKAEAPVAAGAPQQARDHSKTYGNCRWVTPYTWSCDQQAAR